MKRAIFGLVSNQQQANHLVDSLLSAGFPVESISLLHPHQSAGSEGRPGKKGTLTTEKSSKAPEGGVTGAAAGGLLGGTLGLLAGIGLLAIPGVGPFIAAGPIMAALGGSAIGGSVGLVVGTLVGWGIPEYEAKKYEEGLRAGKTLICVETQNSGEITRAEEIFERNNVQDVSTSLEKSK